jgi:hypothetical protein
LKPSLLVTKFIVERAFVNLFTISLVLLKKLSIIDEKVLFPEAFDAKTKFIFLFIPVGVSRSVSKHMSLNIWSIIELYMSNLITLCTPFISADIILGKSKWQTDISLYPLLL